MKRASEIHPDSKYGNHRERERDSRISMSLATTTTLVRRLGPTKRRRSILFSTAPAGQQRRAGSRLVAPSWHLPAAAGTTLLYSSYYYQTQQNVHYAPLVSQCEEAASSASVVVPPPVTHGVPWDKASLKQKIQRAWRLGKRLVKLSVTLAPVALLYPFYRMLSDSSSSTSSSSSSNGDPEDERDLQHVMIFQHHDDDNSNNKGFRGWYLRMCLRCVEHSGAAIIKFTQWAGSRPDLFGHDFCAVFSTLQDNTTPHRWRHTAQMMREAFGRDWRERIELSEILGSGCIGQGKDKHTSSHALLIHL